MGENSAKKLREMTREEIEIRLHDLEEEFQNLRLRASLKQETNPVRMRYLRRAVARAKTMLHEDARGIRSLASQKQAEK